MAREVDIRDHSRNRTTPQRAALLQTRADEISGRMPGVRSIRLGRMNPLTGNPVSAAVAELAPGTGEQDYIQRALQFVQSVSPAMGLTATQAPEFVADPAVQKTSSGAAAVNLQQRYKGIPIFEGASLVRFAPDGKLEDTAGNVVSVDADVATVHKLTVQDVVLKAAQFVNQPDPGAAERKDQFGQPLPDPTIDLSGFAPKVRAAFVEIPEQSTVLEPGPFGAEIKASLIWFPLNDSLVLGWTVLLTFPEHERQYQVIVDANSGAILYSHQMVQYVAAVGNVYRVDGGSARQSTNFPLTVNDFGLPSPAVGQTNWRWCHKCQGLYFGGGVDAGHCPAGAAHDHTGSGDYMLMQSANYPGQQNWRWCHKCMGLYFAGHATQGTCPAGGAHDHAGSGNYVLINQSPLAPGQHSWRWCHKCEGLHFKGGASAGVCPAGGSHDATGSGDYTLLNSAIGLPPAYPDTWVGSNQTFGNCTHAHLNDAGLPMTGAAMGGVMTFNPVDPIGDDQKVLNIFYYCCYMHDFAYLLGFREGDGNFQTDDFGRGGTAGDPVDARSYSGTVSGTANMSTNPDGSSPTMRMGLFTPTGRHTAFDSTVVFHEFTHGISNRLVGGPMNTSALNAPQSGSMGEGWSDYMACTINNTTVVGNWLLNNAKGIRGFAYDSNFPDDFANIGTGRYNEVHNIGELWCATLMEMNRRTDRFFAVQLVMDAFKLTPANPGFLDARDAIVSALNHMLTAGRIDSSQRDGAWQGIWGAFARFGMGPQAHSNGAQLNGIAADYTIGQDNWRWCHKCQSLFFNGHATKGKCAAGGAHESTGSGNYSLPNNWAAAPGQNKWRWCHKCEGMYFSGSATQGVCAAGGAHDAKGSGDYKQIFNASGSAGQAGWHWCHKCQLMHFSGNAVEGACAAGGTHENTGSGEYTLMQLSGKAAPFAAPDSLSASAAGGYGTT